MKLLETLPELRRVVGGTILILMAIQTLALLVVFVAWCLTLIGWGR